jgi:uncharacterized LabA/DUF88 family protein
MIPTSDKPRSGIYVDVQNIYYTTRQVYNRQFNYRALWKHLAKSTSISIAIAYAVDRGITEQQKFQSALRHVGFEVKLKPYISRSDGSSKGDWDVGITIDIIKNAPEIDRIVLLSGDGDFDVLVNYVRHTYDVGVDIYGVSALTASSLKYSADRFYPIDETFLL